MIRWYVSLSPDLQNVYWPAMIIGYLCLIPAGTAIVCMDRLLCNIRKAKVFIKKIQTISVSFPGVLMWLVFFFHNGILASARICCMLCRFFIGVVLRVVNNVFRQAILIREENEYTI